MGTLYENINGLCKERGITGGKMCTDLGISKGLVTDLKMGRRTGVSAKTADKIATYFHVSVGYLLGNEQEKTPTLTQKDERDIARNLQQIMDRLDAGENLMFDGDPMSDEAKESIRAAMKLGLEAAKVKNKERFTPKKYRKETP